MMNLDTQIHYIMLCHIQFLIMFFWNIGSKFFILGCHISIILGLIFIGDGECFLVGSYHLYTLVVMLVLFSLLLLKQIICFIFLKICILKISTILLKPLF